MSRIKDDKVTNARLDAAYDAAVALGKRVSLSDLRDEAQKLLKNNDQIKQLTDNSLYAFLSTAQLQNHPSFDVNDAGYTFRKGAPKPSQGQKENDQVEASQTKPVKMKEPVLRSKAESALQRENEELKKVIADLYLELRQYKEGKK